MKFLQNEYLLKDRILNCLISEQKNIRNTQTITAELGISDYMAVYLTDDLAQNGYIKSQITATKGSGPYGSRIIRIASKGRCFIEFGGYRKLYVQERDKKRWQIAKTAAAVANALLVLAVAVWGITVQIQANKREADAAEIQEYREWSKMILDVLNKSKERDSPKLSSNDSLNKGDGIKNRKH